MVELLERLSKLALSGAKATESKLVSLIVELSASEAPEGTAILLAAADASSRISFWRSFSYHLSGKADYTSLDEWALGYISLHSPKDPTVCGNLLGATLNCLSVTGQVGAHVGPWVADLLLDAMGGPEYQRFSALEMLRHLVNAGQLEYVANRTWVSSILLHVRALADGADDLELEDIAEVANGLEALEAHEVRNVDLDAIKISQAAASAHLSGYPEQVALGCIDRVSTTYDWLRRLNDAAESNRTSVEVAIRPAKQRWQVPTPVASRLEQWINGAIDRVRDRFNSIGDRRFSPVRASFVAGVSFSKTEAARDLKKDLVGLIDDLASSSDDLSYAHAALVELVSALKKKDQTVAIEVSSFEPKSARWFDRSVRSLSKDDVKSIAGVSVDVRAPTRLASIDVPQANRLEGVLLVAVRKAQGLPFTIEDLEVSTHRQLNYYTAAARTLGLVDHHGDPTDRARLLAGLTSQSAQYLLLGVWFEDSLVGRVWRDWTGSDTLVDIPPGSAIHFLSATVQLSTSTIRRRAQTLEVWRERLSEAHYLKATDSV